MTIDPIRIALPSKGHLYEGVVEILKSAGYKVRRASDRQYEATIAGHPRFHVVFMRPTDIVTQVEEGRCHLGVTGMDLYAERAFETESSTVVVDDLGYGACRLVVAVPESWIDVAHVIDLVDLAAEFKDTPNVAAGIRVPTALVGAVLPPPKPGDGPFAIKSATMRGVASEGMLCSARELKLSDDHAGLLNPAARCADRRAAARRARPRRPRPHDQADAEQG